MISDKDFEVSIVGGGIGGLTAAIGFQRAGVPVQIFEAAPQFAEIGAGVSFGKNARDALAQLGLEEEFHQEATTIPSGVWFEWRRGEGEEQELIATTHSNPVGNSSVHRAKFLNSLVKHIPEEISHFGKRLKRLETLPDSRNGSDNHSSSSSRSNWSGRTRMHFEDGTTHDTDVVIGYDGIHSKVREHLDQIENCPPSKLEWSGSWAYRGLVPTEKFTQTIGSERGRHYAETPQMFLGKDRHILTFPIDKNDTVNVVAFTTDRSSWPNRPSLQEGESWTQRANHVDMIAGFPGWGKDMIAILEAIEKPSRWALHQLSPPLDSYRNGTICIAGDAAHGGTPHQGAMAGQAIEDAVFLAWVLSQPSIKKTNLHKALEVYDAVRRPRANDVLKTSLEAGDVYEFAGPQGSDLLKVKDELESRFEWIWQHDFETDFSNGRQELQKRSIQV